MRVVGLLEAYQVLKEAAMKVWEIECCGAGCILEVKGTCVPVDQDVTDASGRYFSDIPSWCPLRAEPLSIGLAGLRVKKAKYRKEP